MPFYERRGHAHRWARRERQIRAAAGFTKTLFHNTPEPPRIHFKGVKVNLIGQTDKIEIRRKYKAWIKVFRETEKPPAEGRARADGGGNLF